MIAHSSPGCFRDALDAAEEPRRRVRFVLLDALADGPRFLKRNNALADGRASSAPCQSSAPKVDQPETGSVKPVFPIGLSC